MKIPAFVKITRRVTYEVIWVDDFADGETLGECRYATKQIALLKSMKPVEMWMTFIHEVLHALSFHNDVGLTERQVLNLEKGIERMLRANKLIKKAAK